VSVNTEPVTRASNRALPLWTGCRIYAAMVAGVTQTFILLTNQSSLAVSPNWSMSKIQDLIASATVAAFDWSCQAKVNVIGVLNELVPEVLSLCHSHLI